MLSFGLTHGMSYVLQLVFLDTCMKEGSKQVIYYLIYFFFGDPLGNQELDSINLMGSFQLGCSMIYC